MGDKPLVYCSGPLFCPEEIAVMTAISDCLEENGYGTFLPHRDGIEAHVMRFVNSPIHVDILPVRGWIDRAIFSLDIYQIVERCSHLVFNMNGRVPDEGGLVETAIACAAGKPVVVYKNDVRTAFGGMDNSMISGLVETRKVDQINKIPAELERVAALLNAHGPSPYRAGNVPWGMEKTIRLGRRIWEVMTRIDRRARKPDEFVRSIAAMVREHGEP